MDPEIEFLGVNLLATTAKRPRHRPRVRQQRLVNVRPEDIIEVSDTDNDEPVENGHTLHAPVAGPSQPRHNTPADRVPLFLPDVHDTPSPGSEKIPNLDDAEYASELGPPASRSASAATPAPAKGTPVDHYVAQIAEIVPDVDPKHVEELLNRHIDSHKDTLVQSVLHILFENPDYPKVDKRKGKGKRKRADEDDEQAGPSKSKIKIDYTDKTRLSDGGIYYVTLALEQLSRDYPVIPKKHIKRTFFREKALYVPTYLALDVEHKTGLLSYKPKTTRATDKGKGKGCNFIDPAFEAERAWLVAKLEADALQKDAALAEELNEKEYEETGNGIECGCCFTTYPFDKMIQCPEAHLFCTDCMSTYCETLLGSHNANIVCMDQSGCKLPFPESELRRFLPEKLILLYDRVKQRKEIEAAGLENLEECPFCEYKVVIENEQEKLFRCENAECGAVTCRACKKLDHLPKSCKEMEEDKKLDARHVVEEAMTRALMRNCPKCAKAFVKEAGCNKMTCPHCRTLSCYACRKVINGYDHFNQAPPGSKALQKSNKCPLWDPVEQRHADEVAAAQKKAIEDYKREHPDVEDKDIRVELPQAPVAGPANLPLLPAHLPHAHHRPVPQVVVHHHGHLPVMHAPQPVPPPQIPLMPIPGMPGLPGMQIGIMGGMMPMVQQFALPPAQGPGYQVNINFEPRQLPQPQPPPYPLAPGPLPHHVLHGLIGALPPAPQANQFPPQIPPQIPPPAPGGRRRPARRRNGR